MFLHTDSMGLIKESFLSLTVFILCIILIIVNGLRNERFQELKLELDLDSATQYKASTNLM